MQSSTERAPSAPRGALACCHGTRERELGLQAVRDVGPQLVARAWCTWAWLASSSRPAGSGAALSRLGAGLPLARSHHAMSATQQPHQRRAAGEQVRSFGRGPNGSLAASLECGLHQWTGCGDSCGRGRHSLIQAAGYGHGHARVRSRAATRHQALPFRVPMKLSATAWLDDSYGTTVP